MLGHKSLTPYFERARVQVGSEAIPPYGDKVERMRDTSYILRKLNFFPRPLKSRVGVHRIV
jgi:hypothetical protein